MIQRIKGTQDFLDLDLFNFLITKAKHHFKNSCFTEIATPIIEPIDLFKRSLGLETDVVTKEMYTIASDNKDETICLRPEATAAVMRAFLNAGIDTLPWKVFTYGPMFRHERPQKGRFRQFHQISLEVIGSSSIAQDATFITMLDRLFHEKLLLENYALLINFLGCPEDRVTFKKVLYSFLEKQSAQLCPTCCERKEKNILRIFDCKNATCQELYKKAPKTTEHLCPICSQEWSELQLLLQKLSVSFSPMATLVRGLDYYDKTVFEFVSTDLGAQNTFCGGGRYDGLAQALESSKSYPSLGAAIGIERVILMLEAHKDKLLLPQQPPLHVIIPLSPAQQTLAIILTDYLLAHDLCATALIEGDSVKSMMRKANKMGARNTLIIGEDEQKAHTVTIKNMITGEEKSVKQTDVIASLKE